MGHSLALVTGTTSGLGYAAARALAEGGWGDIIVTGRSLGRTREAAAKLEAETRRQAFTPLELDLNSPASVKSAAAALIKRGQPIDFVLLNAGMVPGKERVLTASGIEASQAPLIGHHQLTVGLLNANLLSPTARIVIAGAEPARGDVPMFSLTDVAALSAKEFRGDRAAAVEALLRNGPNIKYEPNRAYADAKVIIAWWAAALARRLPAVMAVYAVAPGSAPDTKASRNVAPVLRYVFIPIVKLIPGMTKHRRPRRADTSRPRISAPTSQGSFSPRHPASSPAQLRRCASHTFTIVPIRKLRGRPSLRSLASTGATPRPLARRLEGVPIAASR